VQYWGQKNTTWHYRDVVEFFTSSLDDIETSTKSFSELIDWDETGLWELQLQLMRSQKLPDEFKQVYKANPVFNLMFPKSKIEMNMLALCEDLFDFSNNAKKDYSLYKTLRSYVNQTRLKFKQQPKMYREIDKSMAGVPTHLNFDETWDKYAEKNKTSDNPAYQRITDTYYKIDFKGYKADEKFANLIDDSLHVFYGAHCDYFVTMDDKCHYKATEVYKQLKISTKALKPSGFLEDVKINLKHV
jgi:DNA-binding ferritin-like protein (Dps family)